MTRRAVAVAAVVLLAGCGGDGGGEERPGPIGAPEAAGGRLTYALAGEPRGLDPLAATARAARIVTLQVHEPLIARLAQPFGRGKRARGLALSWAASSDQRVWRFRLRRRVRFQDGRPFNASAVAANATRWSSLPAGRRLLPGLSTADAPRASVVRLVFDRPVPDLPRRLASARLGLVSPAALRPATGLRARLTRTIDTGTGPFELREWRRGKAMTLARSETWWGTRAGLGPALDQLELLFIPSQTDRLDLLRRGQVTMADRLGPTAANRLTTNPLLTTLSTNQDTIGLERSIRGLAGPQPQSLAGVWLTRLEG